MIWFLLAFLQVSWAHAPQGFWRFNLHYPAGDVPFVIEFKDQKALLYNGKERIPLELSFDDHAVIIPLQTYQNSLRIDFEDKTATGTFTRHNKNPLIQFKVDGVLGKQSRFDEQGADKKLQGKWAIEMTTPDGTKTPGILMVNAEKEKIFATILTQFGDYRYLEGFTKKNKFELASFDGVFNFHIMGTFEKDKLTADLISQDLTKITGVKNDKAELAAVLPDVDSHIHFTFPDVNGKKFSLDDYKNKPVIVQIFGSWCPNCIDESLFMNEWYQKSDKKVAILALSFERGLTEAESKMHLKKVVDKRHFIYPFLFAGKTAEDKPDKILPWIKNFKSFPTTLYLDKNHQIKKVESGFNGPSTGEYFEKFKKDFSKTIQELLPHK